MSFINRELEKIQPSLNELRETNPGQYAQLYAIQQALSWVSDPDGFRSPYDFVMGTQEGLEDCSDPLHPLP